MISFPVSWIFLAYTMAATCFSVGLTDLDGKKTWLTKPKPGKAQVVLFLSPECPLCESYSVNIRQLATQYQAKGFLFTAVIPGKEFSKEQVITYRNKYGLKLIPFCFDPELQLADFLNATITPEVYVIQPDGKVIYSGRIDNWAYELGRKRSVITEKDLEKVLTEMAKGKTVKPYKTKSVGCFIR